MTAWTNDRDTLVKGVEDALDDAWPDVPSSGDECRFIAAHLINSGRVKVLDPDDTELVERAVRALHDADGPDGAWSKLDDAQRNFWLREYARAVIEALRQP